MIKFKALAFVAALMFAGSSAFAGEKACCAGHMGADAKGACAATFANLNLDEGQKTKMETLAAECDKGGCDKKSMAKMEKSARGILSKEQFAAWRAACSAKMGEKTES